jgi:alpha-beta hydrolase superfamily lysophospholipase
VKAFRRALLALSFAGVVAIAIRLRGSGGTPPQRGGWRELPLDET